MEKKRKRRGSSLNDIERRMLDFLKILRDNFNVLGVRFSTEDEGIRPDEMHRLAQVVSLADLPLCQKIGGREAITDINIGLLPGVEEIVVPMIESAFALEKFIETIKDKIARDNRREMSFAFNLESRVGVREFDEMLEVPDLHLIERVTIGRVDLAKSLKIPRSQINTSQVLFDICKRIMTKAKKAGLETGLGGAISSEALPIIQQLDENELLDVFETRKIVYPRDAWKFGESALEPAGFFEILEDYSSWRYSSRVQAVKKKRISMLVDRWGEKAQALAAWAEKIIAEVTT